MHRLPAFGTAGETSATTADLREKGFPQCCSARSLLLEGAPLGTWTTQRGAAWPEQESPSLRSRRTPRFNFLPLRKLRSWHCSNSAPGPRDTATGPKARHNLCRGREAPVVRRFLSARPEGPTQRVADLGQMSECHAFVRTNVQKFFGLPVTRSPVSAIRH